jgi:hypothetical protein
MSVGATSLLDRVRAAFAAPDPDAWLNSAHCPRVINHCPAPGHPGARYLREDVVLEIGGDTPEAQAVIAAACREVDLHREIYNNVHPMGAVVDAYRAKVGGPGKAGE